MLVGLLVCLILYNSRICWSILMRFVLLNCLKQRECHGQNKNLKNVKLAILWGKNIIFAMRGRQRENEFGKAVIAMRGPHRENGFCKVVIDNVSTLPRFATTSERQWLTPQT